MKGKTRKISAYTVPGLPPLHPQQLVCVSNHSSPQEIIDIISEKTKIPVKVIMGCSRKTEHILARHACMYLLRYKFKYSLRYIAELMCKKNHTTVLNAIRSAENEFETNPAFRMIMTEIILTETQ